MVILLVEDNLDHAELAMRNLEENRVVNRIVHVEDGKEALDYLYNRGRFSDKAGNPRPHLVLLDLRLPKVDGLEVLSTIKSDLALQTIPVVILTTSSAERDLAMAYDHHANSYVTKPLDFDSFNKMMQDLGFYWLAWNRHPW